MALTINGFNIGTDISVTIQNDQGDVFTADQIGHLMDFTATADDNLLKITPIDNGGRPIFQTVWAGYTGDMTFTRYNGVLTGIIAALMGAFYDQGIMPKWTISATVLNRDGTVDTFVFTQCQFTKPTFGNFNGTKEVDQKIEFHAQDMTSSANIQGVAPALAALVA